MLSSGENADPALAKIAAKHGVSTAQVLLKWGVQRGFAVIPKSTNLDRIRENIGCLELRLDAEDMATMNTWDCYNPTGWDPTKEE